MKLARKYQLKKWSVSLGVTAICFVAIGAFDRAVNDQALLGRFIVSPPPADSAEVTALEDQRSNPFSVKSQSDEVAQSLTLQASLELPQAVLSMVEAGRFGDAKAFLLAAASTAVNAADDAGLAKNLSHLGELALIQSDIDTAEVYLAEALDVYQQIGDEVSEAGVYVQMGRLHLVARQRARKASDAYDTLLISRWKISHGQFYSAEQDLIRVAESNLELNRYGAAASAYETLLKGYATEQDLYQAQLSGLEAIRLHAASGQVYKARSLVSQMRSLGIDDAVFPEIEAEIQTLNHEFQQSILAIGAARDYALLYNQLQARGDVVNAWRFRQQAGESLARASMRAQYRRQPDVLVELYKSNDSMDRARDSLERANNLFRRHGLDSELEKSRRLQAGIF